MAEQPTLQERLAMIDELGDIPAEFRKLMIQQAYEMEATTKSPTTAGFSQCVAKTATKIQPLPNPSQQPLPNPSPNPSQQPLPNPSPNPSQQPLPNQSKSAKILQFSTEPPKRNYTTAEELIAIAESIRNDPNAIRNVNNAHMSELEDCRNCANPITCPKVVHKWQTPKRTGDNDWEFVPCRYVGMKAKNKVLRSSEIPLRYMGKTLADYRVDEDNRMGVKYAKNALKLDVGAYFFGNCGTGKTFLASIIAQDFIRDGKTAIFVKVPALLDDIKSTFNGRAKEIDILDRIAATDLVVLDDFGMEKSTQWAGSTMCKILDVRYDNPKVRTLVTSNLSLKDLERRLNHADDGDNLNGSRIVDRIYGMCQPILFGGSSRRR